MIKRASVTHGLNQSRPQLEIASKKDGLLGVQFVQGDAQQLPYVDEAFDSVISIGSILFWAKPVDVLREVRRVTKAGGQVLLMGFNRRGDTVRN